MESSVITQVQKEDVQVSPKTGQVSRAALKQPQSCNLFKALFCCLQAQDGPKPLPPLPPPSQQALLESQENGMVVKSEPSLLPEVKAHDQGKICMVIDLDETLVHSSFKPISNADFIVPVEIEGTTHQVYVLKRPYVDEFLQRMGELFECVLFTASLAKYADPVTDLLDQCGVFRARLFRESCVFHQGCYVKDLSRLGRDLHKTIILDNSPASYIFHPNNACQPCDRLWTSPGCTTPFTQCQLGLAPPPPHASLFRISSIDNGWMDISLGSSICKLPTS